MDRNGLATLKQIADETGRTQQALRKWVIAGHFAPRGKATIKGRPVDLYDRAEVIAELEGHGDTAALQNHAAYLGDGGRGGRPKKRTTATSPTNPAAPRRRRLSPKELEAFKKKCDIAREVTDFFLSHYICDGEAPDRDRMDGLGPLILSAFGFCPTAFKAAWMVEDWMQCIETEVAVTPAYERKMLRAMSSTIYYGFTPSGRAERKAQEAPQPDLDFEPIDIEAKLAEIERELAALKLT